MGPSVKPVGRAGPSCLAVHRQTLSIIIINVHSCWFLTCCVYSNDASVWFIQYRWVSPCTLPFTALKWLIKISLISELISKIYEYKLFSHGVVHFSQSSSKCICFIYLLLKNSIVFTCVKTVSVCVGKLSGIVGTLWPIDGKF